MKKWFMLFALCVAALAGAGAKDQPVASETKEQRDARMKWFDEARFGLFIHWGVYAVPAGEWKGNKGYGEWFLEETKMPVSQYENFAKEFNPVKFDARAWARMAREAGMKYIVITSKHHDGFGLFPSQLTDWCIKSTPFQRDPLKELSKACRREGIVFCTYHSIMDWHHPDYPNRRAYNDKATGQPDMERFVTYLKGQLKELVTNYHPGIMWFDGEWESAWNHERGVDLYSYLRALDPKLIINNRIGKGRQGMSGMDGGRGVGDYGTPEQEIPSTGFGEGVRWESCMTMNNHWGYNKHDQSWKSTRELVRHLIDCASKGGNYLLNVGPTSEGLFPAPSVERLAEIGRWMKVNGEAIYGTKASPFKRLDWGRCTQKPFDARKPRVPGKLYLHVYNWPVDGKLVVPGLKNTVQKAYLLADAQRAALATSSEGGKVTVSVGPQAPDPIATVVVLEIKEPAEIAG